MLLYRQLRIFLLSYIGYSHTLREEGFGLDWSHDDVLDDADDQDDDLDLCEALTKMLIVGENIYARVIFMQNIFHPDNKWLES